MSISAVQVSNLQAVNQVKTEKTVHLSDINNLKKEIATVKNKVSQLIDKYTPSNMGKLPGWKIEGHTSEASTSIDKVKLKVEKLQGKVADLKGKIDSTSYAHNASKSRNLNEFDNALAGLITKLTISSSKIGVPLKESNFNQEMSDSKQKTAAVSKQQKDTNKEFMNANPHYFNGGMVK